MCVSISPYTFYTFILHTLVERLPPHAPVKWKQIKKSHKRIDEHKRISFFQKRVSYLSPILCFQSQTFNFIHPGKPHHGTSFQNRVIQSPFYDFQKSIFKKFDPIHSNHISADAPFHAESEFVLAFDEKCLARVIINDSWPQFSIWASLRRAYENIRR